jgi:magnesium and cobalt transporter
LKLKKLVDRVLFRHDPGVVKRKIDDVLLQAQNIGMVDASSREMIEKILKFTHTLVREIMIPRTEIVAVDIEGDIEDILRDIVSSRHTRIPVYRETVDNIIGILNIKDIFEFWPKNINKEDLSAVLTPPYYIPETKNAHLLFYEFKENKKHLAIVIDEYGGTAGMVTLEDLLEQIVGELRDEDEALSDDNEILRLADGSFLCEGRTEIEKVEERLGVQFKKGDFETIGGWILNHIKRIPLTGERFQMDGIEVRIESADERQIKKVRLEKKADGVNGKKYSTRS